MSASLQWCSALKAEYILFPQSFSRIQKYYYCVTAYLDDMGINSIDQTEKYH